MKKLLSQFHDICLRSNFRTAKRLMKQQLFDYLDLDSDDALLFNHMTMDYKILRYRDDNTEFFKILDKWERKGYLII